MKPLALLLLLLPTLAVAQTRTIHFDSGVVIADNYLPPDTGYIFIQRGNRAVLEFSRIDRYRPYLFDYSRRYHRY